MKEHTDEQPHERTCDRPRGRAQGRTGDLAHERTERRADEQMDEKRTVKVSKYLSKHLRHQPERIGLTLGEGGWVEIDALISAATAHGFRFTRAELDHVVATNDKRRFAVEGTRIRASQGHSVEVDLGLPPATPCGVPLPRDRGLQPGRDPRRGPETHEPARRTPLGGPGDGHPRRRPPRPPGRPRCGRRRHAP